MATPQQEELIAQIYDQKQMREFHLRRKYEKLKQLKSIDAKIEHHDKVIAYLADELQKIKEIPTEG